MVLLTGIAYPLIVTGVAQGFFSDKANGSLIYREGKPVGSHLIGQPFDDPKYFWGRPSATGPVPYNGAASSGSNVGPANAALYNAVKDRVAALHKVDPDNKALIPVDLVTSSASGLDPHISPAAALYQSARVARLRGVPESAVRELISKNTQPRFLGFLGEPAVNVAELNLDLDQVKGE